MNKWLCLLLLASVCVVACQGGQKGPDVSGIKADVVVKRFERDFFAIDTSDVEASLNKLQRQYGTFLNDYLFNILALPSEPDSVVNNVKQFIQSYTPVYRAAADKFSSFERQENEIEQGLRYVKYYFPGYALPQQVITFVGPFEGYSNVLTGSGIAVGLQLYMGNAYEAYNTDYLREVYPDYQRRRFEAAYIPVNSMTNIINDIYPPQPGNATLIEQMIEEGKRMYVLDKLLPQTADSLKTGYTALGLQGSYDHEAAIWNYFIENDLLYVNDPVQIRDYTNDAPRTEALGQASPGNIGLFVGWQIVKKWMNDHSNTSLQELLQKDGKQLFLEAKYKPR